MQRSLAVFVLAFIGLAGSCLADPPTVFDKVEEDWQLVLTPPLDQDEGPQITTSMSPTGDLSTSPVVAFDISYREYPDFDAGGMQVQVFSNKQLVTRSTQGGGQFNTPNETVSWTQRMSIANGSVTYKVLNGQSTSFGQFPQDDDSLNVMFDTSLTTLSGYNTAFSLTNSGVTWEKNYATSMQLVQVRYYQAGKLIYTDSTLYSINLSN